MTRGRALVGLAISGLLLLLFFRAVDPRQVLASLAEANFAYLPPAILVYFAGVWVRGVRWGMLLHQFARLPPPRLFRAVVIGFAVNDVTPFRLGEIARAYLLVRWAGVPAGSTFATIVVERLFDGLTLCGILVVARLWLPDSALLAWMAGLASVVFVLGTAGAYVGVLWPRFVLRIADLVLRAAPGRLRARLRRLCETFLLGLSVLRRGRLLLLTSALSTAAWLGEALMYYLIMLGFGFDEGLLAALLGMVAANLGSMVPSAPGYVGTFHVPLKTVLTEVFSVEAALAASYTLVVHATLIVPVVLVGAFFLWREGLSLAALASRPAPVAAAVGRDAPKR